MSRFATAAINAVAIVAAVISFDHMRELAVSVGEDWKSWLYPISLDGMLVAASLAAHQAKKRSEKVPGLTMAAIAIGIVISVAANILSSFSADDLPVWLPGALAAWPPIALAIAFEEWLKLRQAGTTEETSSVLEETDSPTVESSTPEETDSPTAEPSEELEEEQAQQQARELIRSGVALSGAALGARFGRSEVWGREQIQAVSRELLSSGQVV